MGKPPKNRKSGGRVTEKGTRPKSPPSSKRKRVEESTATNTAGPKKQQKFDKSKKQDNHHPEKSWKNRPLYLAGRIRRYFKAISSGLDPEKD